jgi:NAD(P)-dependent dehydrogenase (short-subunit alcohol dehydrogenase family)
VDLGIRDRVVLITGGGGGAGPAIARAFAAEGAWVAVHQRQAGDGSSRAEATAAGISSGGGRAIAVDADLRSSDAIAAMIERVSNELGPVSILVTATSAYRNESLDEISDDAWAGVVDDMLGATFRVCRTVAPAMVEAGWGRIVNIAARSGLVGVARASHYASAKAGIVALTASLAKELGPSGVLVNAVAPTQILTVQDGEPSIPPERQDSLVKSIPLRRLATPDDLAALVVWLGSAANGYVSGQTITLSGGAQS